jgi:DnaJ family protein C protein 28
MRQKATAIEAIIQAAMHDGAFDDLPGQGQPLDWDPNDFSGDDWALAHHLLKENGFAPEFIEIRKSIESDLEQYRADFKRAKEWREEALTKGEPKDWIESQWGGAQSKFTEQIAALNKRIRDYNLIIPAQNFYRSSIDADRESQPFLIQQSPFLILQSSFSDP